MEISGAGVTVSPWRSRETAVIALLSRTRFLLLLIRLLCGTASTSGMVQLQLPYCAVQAAFLTVKGHLPQVETSCPWKSHAAGKDVPVLGIMDKWEKHR